MTEDDFPKKALNDMCDALIEDPPGRIRYKRIEITPILRELRDAENLTVAIMEGKGCAFLR
jgi:hypothetical protein